MTSIKTELRIGVGHRDYGAFNVFDGIPVPNTHWIRQPYLPPRRLEKILPSIGNIASYAVLFLPIRKVDFYHSFNSVVLNKKPWIVTFESILPRVWGSSGKRHHYYSMLERDECRKILAISKNALKLFQRQNQEEKTIETVVAKAEVVYPGVVDVPQAFEKHQARTEPKVPHIAFIGAEFFRKGGPVAVEAVYELKKQMNVNMTIISSIGEGTPILPLQPNAKAKWKQRIQETDIQWIERMNSQQIRSFLADVDILLHPTFNDSFGYVVVEAMAAGVVPIASRVDALPEIVVHQENGWLINVPLDEGGSIDRKHVDLEDLKNQVVKAVCWVLEDRKRYVQLSHAARATYESKFTRQRLARDLERIYGQIQQEE